MNLFFQKSVVASMKAVDAELDSYFRTATKFRSRARNGTVVIVDPSTSLYSFLDELVNRCNLRFCLYHVKDAPTARKVLAELGEEHVKVVVINCDLLFASANGVTLAQWIEKYFPNIPIWISECSKDRSGEIRKLSRRVGIIPKGEPLTSFVDVLGFPSRCHGNGQSTRKRHVHAMAS